MIRLARPDVRIVATEPAGAALLSGAEFKPHKIQGWTPDFVPKVLNRSVPHEIIPVTDDESIAASRALAGKEGIFCGISSGGNFAAALKVAEKAPGRFGHPDGAGRYGRALPVDGVVRGHRRGLRPGALSTRGRAHAGLGHPRATIARIGDNRGLIPSRAVAPQ